MKILIIDDEPKIRKGIEHLLSQHDGWSVHGFADAENALAFLYENSADVLITDIQMPGLSGLDMIERIRKTNRAVAILILSGYSRFDYAQRAIEMGVRKYLTKPTDPQEMIRALEQIESELQEDAEILADQVGASAPEKTVGNLLVLRAMQYLEREYASHVTLRSVADELFISPNYLSELFSKTTGIRFSEYLLRLRMEKAKLYLLDVSYKVSDVTALVGFSDARSFSSAFKRLYHMTPLEYRNREVEQK
jgi:YesN/AraC family two-component response regulator